MLTWLQHHRLSQAFLILSVFLVCGVPVSGRSRSLGTSKWPTAAIIPLPKPSQKVLGWPIPPCCLKPLLQCFRLWDEYRYVTEYCGQMLASDLLTAAQKQFPELTSSVLSRVMKFTFPKCPKTLNKQGTFYTGLVRRPEVGKTHVLNKIPCTEEHLMTEPPPLFNNRCLIVFIIVLFG